MDEFKVNVSKEALEKYYGREMSGQEVETARLLASESMAKDFGISGWKETGLPINEVDQMECLVAIHGYKVIQAWTLDHGDDFPGRPLSDFLPAPTVNEVSETEKSDSLTDGVYCANCRNFEGACPVKEASPWSKFRQFCADFESLTTGLGVEGTILNRKEAVPRVDGDGNFIGILDEFTPIPGVKMVMNGDPTPNCALCRWAKGRHKSNGRPYAICEACGYLEAHEAHNTPECKALYEPKE